MRLFSKKPIQLTEKMVKAIATFRDRQISGQRPDLSVYPD